MFRNRSEILRERGFTLVEIMVALLVFSVIMLGVAGGLIATLKTNRGNVLRDEALRIAEDELNQLKGLPFSSVNTSDKLLDTGGAWKTQSAVVSNIRSGTISFVWAKQISDLTTATATAFKRIDVAVGWDDPAGGGAALPTTGKNHEVTLSSIIVRSD